jgi:glutamate synthase domain-containing protein 3
VAAGMTGGLGYFYDEEGDFEDKVNAEIVTVQAVRTAAGEAQLRALLSDHVEKTGALLRMLPAHAHVTSLVSIVHSRRRRFSVRM